MRILVLGNCQAHGIAHGLVHLLPDARIRVVQVDKAPRSPRVQAALASVAEWDVVVAHPFIARSTTVVEARRPVIEVPQVVFRGYHPDMAYIMLDGRQVESPLGVYHSCIVAAAFSLGMPKADVATLFNRLVYARLGYMGTFGKARTLLSRQLLPYGEAFLAPFASWHARGPFMHTFNHPRVFVLADIARAAAVGAGLLREDTPAVTPAYDHLAGNAIWPVYPEIADVLGVPGGLLFKRAAGEPLHLSLAAFIGDSYARYAELPEAPFREGAVGAARIALAGYLGCGQA